MRGMRVPPANLQGIMQRAAVRAGVPYTLLAAIAYAESTYKIDAKSPPLKSGGHALGLFQLTPATAADYGVTDPLDPVQCTDGAARYVGWLTQRYRWDWTRVLAAYQLGATGLERRERDGSALPKVVIDYIEQVTVSRRWLQRRIWEAGQEQRRANRPAPAPGAQQTLDLTPTAMQRLNAAIEALSRANPDWLDTRQLVTLWRDWYTPTRAQQSDDMLFVEPWSVIYWKEYEIKYDRAPLTPGDVPPPSEIAPTLWERFKAEGQRIYDEARTAYRTAADAVKRRPSAPIMTITVDDPAIRPAAPPIGLLALFAIMIVFATQRHHSS